MVSKETGDIYSTNQPQTVINSRIAFFLKLHNGTVQALWFPSNTLHKQSAEKRRERQQQVEKQLKKVTGEVEEGNNIS